MTRELLLLRWLLHRQEAFRVGPFACCQAKAVATELMGSRRLDQ
jgi:hypothetical protein